MLLFGELINKCCGEGEECLPEPKNILREWKVLKAFGSGLIPILKPSTFCYYLCTYSHLSVYLFYSKITIDSHVAHRIQRFGTIKR